MQWFGEFETIFSATLYANNNVLPNTGGWTDQPYKLMHYVNLVNLEKPKHG